MDGGAPVELTSLAQQVADVVKQLVCLPPLVWRASLIGLALNAKSAPVHQVGQVKFTAAYSRVRERVIAVRQQRKRKRATEKVLDPQVCGNSNDVAAAAFRRT